MENYDDVEFSYWKYYVAFKVNNNIIGTIELFSKFMKSLINLKETEINDPDNKVRDVTNIGHRGIGRYEFKIHSEDDFYYFNKLFKQSYDEKI